MEQKKLYYLLEQLAQEKGLAIEDLIEAIESALLSAVRKKVDPGVELEVEFDVHKGAPKVFRMAKAVEGTPGDPSQEVSLEEARKYNPEAEPGDLVKMPYPVKDLGRIAAQTAKQVMLQKMREAERDVLYNRFADKEGDVLVGQVLREEKGVVVVDLGHGEGIMPPRERVKGERYRRGETYKFYVLEVRKGTRDARVVLSRHHPNLLLRLFQRDIPEVANGLVEVKEVAREAGSRSKVAVLSKDPEIDAVGSCVGVRGSRIQSVVKELQGESIDVVEYSEEPSKYIAYALKPAVIQKVILDEDEHKALVVVDDDQYSLALGKKGQNVRLAAKLTGWNIDVKKTSDLMEPLDTEGEDGEEE